MTEFIKVTEADIREAHMRQGAMDYQPSRDCPIGQAVIPKHPDWRIDDQEISIWAGCVKLGTIPLPPEAVEFVERFDDGLPVEPFEFTIEVD